ncbi:hypothetical protein CO007_05415 [Candidatus Roizmanbacteria bacterium CG_4_8_14_3_um_filter_36_10]|uniref:Uncharacterized protein n=1 Tax=Candidatus Roizmanbacteria bacterium CG_4_8_14_3_um_filter_36_10 TaxID=1974834 RepID=A0A2M8GL52_9BACT|nr:MAG: hypothetical protein CO007_05415 [Candidatus Roizmanbacteria bacterium CG_4_8_14_3_um_filter_36_10]
MDEVNKVFTRLIPNEEDFFSIIVALDTISKKTNFIITGYSINLQTTNKNKLALTIGGAGDNEAFFNFLRDYRYVGGRLITIDKINYNTTTFAQTQLGVNFYNGNESKSTLITAAKLSQADKKLIKEILNKVTLELKGGDEDKSASSSAYSIKNNPF